jgi:hypothetical protein
MRNDEEAIENDFLYRSARSLLPIGWNGGLSAWQNDGGRMMAPCWCLLSAQIRVIRGQNSFFLTNKSIG